MTFEYICGDIQTQYEDEWFNLVNKYGSAFQMPAWCRVFESSWDGIFYPRHLIVINNHKVVAVIPAYLYESCPRIDYYKKACPHNIIKDHILLSHALVGWYGYPVAKSAHAKEIAIQYFYDIAKKEDAIAMFAGIDGRDEQTIKTLEKNGYVIAHFHTLMVRDLKDVSFIDPTLGLPQKRRARVRNTIKLAHKAGTTTRLATPADYNDIVQHVSRVLKDMGTPPEVLPNKFVLGLLKNNLFGLEEVLAIAPNGDSIGVQINFHLRSTYYICLGGHDRNLLNKYYQSHLLYETSIKRAIELGCSEIQAGRDPYEIKKQHGFLPIPLVCAIRGSNFTQHQRATDWIKFLEKRHLTNYPII